MESFRLTLAGLILSLSGPALAEDCALVARLDAWVSQAMALPAGMDCALVGRSAVLARDGAARSQAGAYHPGSGRILLSPDLDLSLTFDASYLVHELVHAAQYRSGTAGKARCEGQLEAEAYGIQAQFLREAGQPRDALLIALLGAQLGHCASSD